VQNPYVGFKTDRDGRTTFKRPVRVTKPHTIPEEDAAATYGHAESYSDPESGIGLSDATGLIVYDGGGLSADSASGFAFQSTQFTNVQDLWLSGNTLYISHGDLVVDGADYYFDVTDSYFIYENGKIKKVLAKSGKDNNTFIIRNTYIVADAGQEFDVSYAEDGMSILDF